METTTLPADLMPGVPPAPAAQDGPPAADPPGEAAPEPPADDRHAGAILDAANGTPHDPHNQHATTATHHESPESVRLVSVAGVFVAEQDAEEAMRQHLVREGDARFKLTVKQARAKLREMEASYERKKKSAAEAKADMEEQQAVVNELIDQADAPDLFNPRAGVDNGPEPDAGEAGDKPQLLAVTDPGAYSASEEDPDKRWEAFLLADLRDERFNPSNALKPRHLGALNGASPPILTIKHWLDFFAPGPTGYCKRWGDIKQFGETGYEAMSDCLERFWKAWRDDRDSLFPAEPAQPAAAEGGAA